MKMNTLLVFAVLGALLMLSGCAQSNTTTTTDTTTTTENNTDTTTDGSLDQSASGTTDAMDGTTTDDSTTGTTTTPVAGADISAFATASPTNGYKADYTTVITGTNVNSSTDVTMYGKYPKFRNDVAVSVNGTTINTRVYFEVGGDTTYTCSDYGGNWSCQDNATYDTYATPATQASDPDFTFEADGTKVVAGENGTCFKGQRISEPEQSFKVCYTTDGILLYSLSNSGEGYTNEMTATSVVRGIDDSTFTIPV